MKTNAPDDDIITHGLICMVSNTSLSLSLSLLLLSLTI